MRSARRCIGSIATLAVAATLVAGTAAAKPLYITVPRSYGPEESAVVDVAFAEREPVEMRILKPDDLDKFLSSQSNLRRAYEEPSLTVNPGRYLARGLNDVKSPGHFLLLALDPGLRHEVSSSMPQGDRNDVGRVAKLDEGSPKLVGIPPGMTLVKSQWLNLDLGGTEKEFTVPGFNEWTGDSGYQERKVTLDPLPAGVYVVQIVQGRIEGQVVLVVSGMTVQAKQTSGKLLVRVATRDQRPKAGAEVKLYVPGVATPSGKTNDDGEVTLDVKEPKLLAAIRDGSDTAIVDTDFYSTLAVTPDVFLYTDRPIYKPGDTIGFRGVVRRPDGVLAQLFAPKKKKVTVALEVEGGSGAYSSSSGPTITTTASVDEFACFHGELKVPDSLEQSAVVRVVATVDDREEQAEARVQEYVKPTFYVEVNSDQESIQPGDTIHATMRARRYSGGAPAHTAYEVYLYRTVLDTPTWVDDAGMGGQGSAVTYGSQSTTEGKLSVPKKLWSTLDSRESGGGEDSWSTAATFDDKGEASIDIPVPQLDKDDDRVPYKYTVTVRARDDQGTFANASHPFFSADSEVLGTLRPSQKVTLTGGKVQLAVRATSLGGKVYGETKGHVDWVLRDADGGEKTVSGADFATGADGVWRGDVPTDGVGTVIAKITLKDKKDRPWSGETLVRVAGQHGEPVEKVATLTADALDGTLSPGDSAQIVALFPDAWGPGGKNGGPVWLTLEGSTIFETKRLDVDGSTLIQTFPAEKRFGSAVYASIAYPTSTGRWEERVIPFRIVPTEKTLGVSVAPARAEAAPLGKQTIDVTVRDSNGHGVVSQVSVGVVDKAIYALQTELRPGIVPFFYPLMRDNVTSFYSSEFQGYGYGELLARAEGRIHGYEFAAIKPPTRKKQEHEKDTAYWNPAVTTDRDGHASVTFDLPSNQTLWTVTVVAADASGRFGEGTGEFATRGAMTLVSSVPSFLRAGDHATASVRVTRNEKGNGSALTVSLASDGAALTATGGSQPIGALPSGGEKVVPFDLVAQQVGSGRLRVSVAGGAEAMGDRRDVKVEPDSVEDFVAATTNGGGPVALALPKDATVEKVELELGASSVELALGQLGDLLEYPYGCLEQLNATTIPNVAVYSTLEKVGALDKLDPQSQALLAEAKSRSVQGLARMLDLEVKGGGFVLWPGETQPSMPLTLIALDGLTYAVDAGLVPGDDPRIVESAIWLGNQQNLSFEEDATRAYVLARLRGPKEAPRVRQLVDRTPDGDYYSIALAVLAAEEAGIAKEPGFAETVDTLVMQTAKGVALVDYRPQDEEFLWDYPLRTVGTTAILAHAASYGNTDVSQLRARLVSVLSSTNDDVSTFDRSTFLLHSLWLLEKDAKDMRAMTPPDVSGASGKVRFTQRGAGLVAVLDPSDVKLAVGKFDGIATLRAEISVPADKIQPEESGMTLARKYFVLRGGRQVELKDGDAVSQGEDVFVQFTLDAHGGDRWRNLRSAYYVLEDSIPAGFVALEEDKTWRAAPWSLPLSVEALKRRTFSPERADFFFEEPAWWSDSPRTVGYVMRAQFAGSFVAPPAQLTDMYAKVVHARTGGFKVAVTPSQNGR